MAKEPIAIELQLDDAQPLTDSSSFKPLGDCSG